MPLLANAFDTVKQENSRRLGEIRTYWSSIKDLAEPPPTPQPFVYLVGTGLTLVYCYGVLEFCLNRCVEQASELIDAYSVRSRDICQNLMCLAHDPEIKSLINAGKKSRVAKRLSLFSGIHSNLTVSVYSEFLAPDLQNVWPESFKNVFETFGIDRPSIFEPRMSSTIARLVEDRNAIAHGRTTPEDIGKRYSLADVDTLIANLSIQNEHVIQSFEQYYEERKFISPSHRSRYKKRDNKNAG